MVFENLEIFNSLDIVEPNRVRVERKNFHSTLMLSALNLKHLNRLDSLNADIAIINLEDGVAIEKKSEALKNSAIFLSHLKSSNSLITVRINELSVASDEIELLNIVKPDAIRVPKIKTPKDVEVALNLINEDIDIHLSIETKEALASLSQLKIDSRVKFVHLGILDMLESLEIPQSSLKINNPTINYILSKFLIDAKVADLKPVSFIYQDYRDIDGFREWCEFEKKMGFSAKGAISPAQVDIINEVFKISTKEIEKANYIKNKFEEMVKSGVSGFVDDIYGFIDEPIYKDALNVLELSY